MNDSRLRLREAQQTTTARKVLDAVPIAEAWPTHSVIAELTRQGMKYSPSVVEGCLNSLKDDGLVKEVHKGEWQRVHVPVKESGVDTASPDGADALAFAVMTRKQAPDLLTRVEGISSRLRALADEIDSVALQCAEEIDAAKAGSIRFDQLKRLLKDVIQ